MPIRILGIETTCDETAASVFTDEPRILSSVVASQADLHARFGGVVPEIASRAHLERLLPVMDQALRDAGTELRELSAIAVCHTPGLVGAILVGLTAAKTLSLALEIPLIGVNHLEAHLFACQLASREPVFPAVGLVVSGGHTNLFHCRSATDWDPLGSTIDDAAGEAFDKVANLLGLGYPGGPAIEKAAEGGNPKAFDLPRTFLRESRLDFSFSGIKTAVRYLLEGQNSQGPGLERTPQCIADLAASFQAAVVEVLVAKTLQAVRLSGADTVCVAGGVAANRYLRNALEEATKPNGIRLVVPPLAWCTDNAAMAAVAVEKFRMGVSDPLDLDAIAGLVRFPANRAPSAQPPRPS